VETQKCQGFYSFLHTLIRQGLLLAALPATVRLPRHAPPPPLAADHAQHEIKMMASTTAEPLGQSGSHYLIERVLQEKGNPPRRVYRHVHAPEAQLATLSNLLTSADPALGAEKFLLKDVSQSDFKYFTATCAAFLISACCKTRSRSSQRSCTSSSPITSLA